MNRRNLELLLLCVAAPIVVLLFAMMALTEGETLGLTTLGVPLGIFAAFILAHLAVRKFSPNADPAILPISFALSGIGIAFVTRLAPDLASRQVIWLFVGVAAMVLVLALARNVEKLAKYKYTLMIAGLVLMLSPLLPVVGTEIYGSRIWLQLGPLSFQPGELAKICIILFLAAYLAQNREILSVFTWHVGPFRLPDPRALLPLLLMWGLSMVVAVFEKDLGSALVLFFVFLAMLYIASGRKFYLVVGLVLAAIAAVVLYSFFGHVQVRVATWLNPFADAQDTGYQLVQAIYSMADGGLFGVGIGNGLATLIPIVESDFIFAAIAEEMGLLGAAGVLLLYLCFAVRGFVTAARAKSDVSSFLAAGLTIVTILQAFIIVGGVTRLIPLTGLTLPFVSQGGSSLLASFMGVGFLLRCGDEGTGVSKEMTSATGMLSLGGTLGRVALGKRLTAALVTLSILFAILVANLTVIMVVQADYYKNLAGNNHTISHQTTIQRGTISTSDGVVLAQIVKTDDGSYERQYPAGTLASHVVGYSSLTYGTSGIEASYNETLMGDQNYASWSDVLRALSGGSAAGNDVTLTINSTIQKAAEEALQGQTGACVVMNPNTGAVLALASSPTYDANNVEQLLTEAASGTSNSSALYNRATSALYAPGSTFKIVSLTTALENKIASENDLFDAPGTMTIGNAEVSNFNKQSYGTTTLARATELSSNTVYGQLGVKMGSKMLVAGTDRFGFDGTITFDLPVATSVMPDPTEMTEWETAWAAAGVPVGEHSSSAGPQATVLQMALVGCAIANDGVINQPYLVESIHNPSGIRSYEASTTQMAIACSADTAQRVRTVLEGVVNNGTGTAAAVYGVQVAGKTGTAEHSNGDDSWFVGFAPSGDSSVVVAIVLEKSSLATVRSQNVFETALEVQGLL